MQDGRTMGCTDGGRPELHTDEQLSRAMDLLEASKAFGIRDAVWQALPVELRMDFVYSRWTYRAAR